MPEEPFEIKVKNAFSKVKEDIETLKNRLDKAQNAILDQNNLFQEFIKKLDSFTPQVQNISLKTELSTGNEGVQTNNQSNNQTIKQTLNKQSNTMLEIENAFFKLPKRQFLVFLTIYELSEQGGVTYQDISHKLGLSPSCIRSYVHELISRGFPLTKKKFNNKLTFLSINPEFRDMGLKQRIINIFYEKDPNQTTFNSHFF